MPPYINSVNLNAQSDFPYLVLHVTDDQSVPRNPGFQVMHWHEDLQFTLVLSGAVEVVTLGGRQLVQAGEAVFINRNVVHLIRKLDSCQYRSFIFPERFLKFYPGSPAEAFVSRITGQSARTLYHFDRQEKHERVLSLLHHLHELEEAPPPFYAYEVLLTLCSLWLAFMEIAPPMPESAAPGRISERMTCFLGFIQAHFAEPLTLSAIAGSANVSESECLRCFRIAMNTTPLRYLMEFRLSQAAELLRTTDAPISTIAADVGFTQTSHFSQCFREKTGCTPSGYRKRKGREISPPRFC